eukprot:13589790-Heterocapsa_arctica.AAC.1
MVAPQSVRAPEGGDHRWETHSYRWLVARPRGAPSSQAPRVPSPSARNRPRRVERQTNIGQMLLPD